MNSYTEENYLKAIYKLSLVQQDSVTTNALAETLKTKAASVTDMLQKLAEKKLIHYKKYQGVSLTANGKKVAISIIRKHRLWEVFLVEKLGFGWDEVHDIAEQLEHIRSEELIERLDKFLNYPRFDPHGDPIPDINGKFAQQKSQLLSTVQLNQPYIMVGVVDHTTSFLQYLDKIGLALGEELKVKEVNEYDKSITVQLKKKNNLFLSNEVSRNILVSEK